MQNIPQSIRSISRQFRKYGHNENICTGKYSRSDILQETKSKDNILLVNHYVEKYANLSIKKRALSPVVNNSILNEKKKFNTQKHIHNNRPNNFKYFDITSPTRSRKLSWLSKKSKSPQPKNMTPFVNERRISISMNNQISCTDFDVLKKLGAGKYGNVYLIRDKQSGFIAALKAISKKSIKQKQLQNQLIREIKIQSFLKHHSIIKLYGIFDDQQNVYMITELGCHGQLFEYLQRKKTVKEETAAFIIKQLLDVTTYMHSKQILHRDLKPENIVVTYGHPKICDFGWSVYNNQEGTMRNTFCGTPMYFSPELLLGKGYDQKVDEWAIGVMAYQFVTGQSPFHLKSPQDIQRIVTQHINLRLLNQCSQSFRQFILLALHKNPRLRSSSSDLLNTQFIRKYANVQVCEQLCCQNEDLQKSKDSKR